MARLGVLPRQRLELPSYEAVLFALKNGYGIAAMMRYVVDAELRAGSLIALRVPGWNARAVVSVLRVRDALLTPSANQFQALVRERFAEISRKRPRKPR